MCKQYQDVSRSYEAGYEFAKYNNSTSDSTLRFDASSAYKSACKEAERLEEAWPDPGAFKAGFEAFEND